MGVRKGMADAATRIASGAGRRVHRPLGCRLWRKAGGKQAGLGQLVRGLEGDRREAGSANDPSARPPGSLHTADIAGMRRSDDAHRAGPPPLLPTHPVRRPRRAAWSTTGTWRRATPRRRRPRAARGTCGAAPWSGSSRLPNSGRWVQALPRAHKPARRATAGAPWGWVAAPLARRGRGAAAAAVRTLVQMSRAAAPRGQRALRPRSASQSPGAPQLAVLPRARAGGLFGPHFLHI
jgi:hypothetical protein